MAILPVEFLMEMTRPFSSAANNLVLPFELLSFEKNSSSEPITLETWALWLHADNSGHISGYPETLKLSTFTF